MINVLILSNKQSELEQISKNLRRSTDDSLCIITTTSAHEALQIVNKNQIHFDIFIIAMQLENHSGYMIEKMIRKNRFYQYSPFIFIGSFNHLFSNEPLSPFPAYRLRNYIILPLTDVDIQGKFSLYFDYIYSNQILLNQLNKKMLLQTPTGKREIPIKSILYIEVQSKLCTIYTVNGKYLLRNTSLVSALDKINSSDLVRCHRYFAANINNIDYIEHNSSRISTLHFKASHLMCPASSKYLQNIQHRVSTSH